MNGKGVPEIWLLKVGGQKNMGVIPDSLEYFADHFRGRRMACQWSPPRFSITGKGKKLRDFVSWMHQAPLVSQRAKDAIVTICGDDVEMLPFGEINGKPYYAMNVLRLCDVLDLDKSEASVDAQNGRIISVSRFGFKGSINEDLPPIFKIAQGTGDILVTRPFVDLVVSQRLGGLRLADPTVNNFQRQLRGEAINVVEGVIE